MANIPAFNSISNTVRPICIAIYFPILLQLFMKYFDGLVLKKYIDLWYILVLPIMICLDLYVCYPYVNRDHRIDAVILRLAISIFYFFISSCIENIPLYESSKRAKTKITLLRKIFPLKVLNELMENKEVTPQVQTNVTVLFSDIKGFVNICSEIGPIDTFSLLNKLYHVLDLCCEVCGVYKVETIGDAYMIAAGLNDPSNPVGNAVKVANFAQLAQHLTQYVKLDSGKPIELRMGIHSGSCVTGIVGELMPRYCLFGDTINVSNRLQSTSEVRKIHISEQTQFLLSSLDQFETILRNNNTLLKGKDGRATYWLESKINEKNTLLNSEFISSLESDVVKLLKQY
jgi:class 3 adenylate cyclase